MAIGDDVARKKSRLSEQRALLEKQPRGKPTSQAEGISRRLEEGPAPLSFSQERLWFLDQLDPGNPAYNLPTAVRLVGRLDVAALKRALNGVVERHESLRTTFAALDGRAVQVVAPALTLLVPVVDLGGLVRAEREAVMQRLATQEAQRPFDLTRGPLVRATLLKLDEGVHVLLLTVHHIVSDGWSMGVLVQEVAVLYDAFSSGRPSPLAALPLQYADFACWQRNWLQGEMLEAHVAYWRQQLADAPAMLELPTDRPRPAVQSFVGAIEHFEIGEDWVEKLRVLGQQEGVSLYMMLLAAYQTLLYRYTGQEDMSVGSFIANRNRSQTEWLIGFFVNTLVLRTDLSGAPTFLELLARVRAVVSDAYAHCDVPFEVLIETLQPARDLSQTPLFQVAFAWQDALAEVMTLPHLAISPLEIDYGVAQFELTLAVDETAQGLRFTLTYRADLWEAATIARMAGHFETLLVGLVAQPAARLSELPILTEVERQQLLVAWNGTRFPHLAHTCLHRLFEAQAARTPDAVALVFETQEVSYDALNRQANRLAHHLQARGVGPEVLVGICVARSVEMVVALLAVLKAGGAYLPLDPEYPQQRLAFMLQDTRSPLLLTQTSLRERIPPYQGQVICLDADWAAIAQEDENDPTSQVTADNLAYVIYTSGSTGLSKGVAITHATLCPLLHWGFDHLPLSPDDRSLQYLAYIFDWSVWEMFLPLTSGASLCLVPADLVLDPQATLDLMVEQHVTVLHGTPTQFHYLTALGQPLTSLRYTCIGAEKLTFDLALRTHGLLSPDCRLFNMYGPTEATIMAAVLELDRRNLEALRHLSSVPIGPPIANNRCYVLDAHLHPQPTGVPGELYIAGGGLARGYLGRPALTAERFVPDPFEAQGRAYRTGDLVKWLPDGALEFLGRIDYQVKLRGFRIELGEIEATLVAHPAVQQAVALVREDQPGERYLAAYVLPQPGHAPDPVELRAFLQERLPDYMLPAAILALDALPQTPSGKVDRKALPQPQRDGSEQQRAYVAPRNPTEEVLAGIWAHILNVKQVGGTDNFFELGGHSLLATQVISRVRDAFGVELPLRTMFGAPTVASLTRQVEATLGNGVGGAAPPIGRVSRESPLPLSFAQQQLWLIDQLAGGNVAYNIPFPLRLSGSLDVAVLHASLEEVVHRHEALRTILVIIDRQPVQSIAPAPRVFLPMVDLCVLSDVERQVEAQRLAQQDARRPFDLAIGPLWRVTLLRLSEAEHLLLLTMHHVVTDGWSLVILMNELAALYRAFAGRRPSPLPPLPIQYADFAVWQREWLQGEALETQLSFWRRQLAGAPALLALPTDRPRPSFQTFRGVRQSLALSWSLSETIKALSQRAGATLFMTLLAAFKAVLYRYTNEHDIVVGSPIANRNRAEIEGLVGYFVNTLVLRTDLSGDPTFGDLLVRVRETALGAYAHADLPFEKLVEALRPERNPGYNPLFQVMFTLQSGPQATSVLPDLTVSPVAVDPGVSLFDLRLEMEETAQGLLGFVEYNTDLFDDLTVVDMLAHYRALLERVVADAAQPLSILLSTINVAQRAWPGQDAGPSPDGAELRKTRIAERQARLTAAQRTLFEEKLRGK